MLPPFPRTPHLPHNPNLEPNDLIASNHEAGSVFTQLVNIEEKVDGASVGVMLFDDEPVIRNRDHILRKGYVKDTAAKKQFASIWNWFYKNKKSFEQLNEEGPYAVYGEWCLAQHGIFYNRLPDWFIAYDVYDYEQNRFVSPIQARSLLSKVGFSTPKLLFQGEYKDGYDELAAWANDQSEYGDATREGIYLKVYDDRWAIKRFKMVSPKFERGKYWSHDKLTKNKCA